jgi:hypothetical protein
MQLLTTMLARAVFFPKINWHELGSHEDSANATCGSGLRNELSIEKDVGKDMSTTQSHSIRGPAATCMAR